MFGIPYVSCVMCQVSHVAGEEEKEVFFFGRSGGASQLRVCYQWGLPRLVTYTLELKTDEEYMEIKGTLVASYLARFVVLYHTGEKPKKLQCSTEKFIPAPFSTDQEECGQHQQQDKYLVTAVCWQAHWAQLPALATLLLVLWVQPGHSGTDKTTHCQALSSSSA